MNTIFSAIEQATNAFKENFHFTISIVLLLIAIQILNKLFAYRLNFLGIYPRSWHGFIGIFFSPVLHGDFNHLFFNIIPLFVLVNFVLLEGQQQFYCATLIIVCLGGFLVWLFGRKAIHIGASGVIMGYFSYLLINAYHHPTILTVFLGLISLYYFGALIFHLFPTSAEVSWEGHVFGFLAGIVANYLCPLLIIFCCQASLS